MNADETGVDGALKILAKKHRISRKAFNAWCDQGLVKFRTEPHGMFEWRVFKIREIERIKDLLPKERVIGLSLLPRTRKSKP